MKQSKIFYTEVHKELEVRIKAFMNNRKDYMSEVSSTSPRALGDAIQSILSEHFESMLGDLCKTCTAEFARRAMADIAFTDQDDFYYVVDVKTHRLDTHFNMPNLTSVERISRFYEDDKNYFIVLNLAYQVEGTKVIVEKVHFVPIEFLSWQCLTIGALGWGQIQIANSNNIIIKKVTRKAWMLEFCDIMLEYYPKEVEKVHKRLKHFYKIKEFWESKPD